MTYKITFDKNPKQDDIQIIENGITEYDRENKNYHPAATFAFFLRNDDGQIVGGCHGELMYGHLYIGHIWIAESLRNKGYGTELMYATEKFAKENNCHFIATNTMSWQALEFYQKLNFYVEFERHGFDNDGILYFLRKNL